MKGIELCEKYFYEYGLPMLESEFSELLPRMAIGVVGQGSELLGYDDEISRDHDFEPGFCIWLTAEDYKKYEFKLSRAYSKLPKEFMGIKRLAVAPADGPRHGVFSIDDFYIRLLGTASVPLSVDTWLNIPSHYLKTATCGKVFIDNLGEFTKMREYLSSGYPEDVRLKKIAAHSILCNQSGQYNYARSLAHGENGSAQLAINEFVRHVISIVYLLNNTFEPFYKWVYRGLRELPVLSELEAPLTFLTETGNSDTEVQGKLEIIEDICRLIIDEYHNQGLAMATCNNMDTHAYSIQDKIKDANLRNLNVFIGA